MKTRRLGKTDLQVSEIGFGGEWLERHPEEESIELIHYASSKGINILDCWMADPKSRDIIGKGIKDNRSQWFIQGHIGSTWKNEQYFRTRDMKYVRPATGICVIASPDLRKIAQNAGIKTVSACCTPFK